MISLVDTDDWDRNEGRKLLASAKVNVPAEVRNADAMLEPVEGRWLADRLKALWQSSSPSGSMTAEAWLRETGRLIKHLPFDIAHHAIDTAMVQSNRGFTPTAGAILAIAEPLLLQRRRVRARLKDLTRALYPWERQVVTKGEQCSPEEAKAIMEELGVPSARHTDFRNLREPTPEELAEIARQLAADCPAAGEKS